MSILFQSSSAQSDVGNKEDLFDFYSIDETTETSEQNLPRRQKRTFQESQDNDFGIPIYDLLKRVRSPQTRSSMPAAKTRRLLLTEKYKPQRFVDLVGSDDVHRRIMRWLTAWRHGTPPEKRILLVHGPSGSGKTTAVHVMVRQAGFDVLEVNASDERQVISDRMQGLYNHQSTASRRPACMVADDIDGCDGRFVRTLVSLVSASKRKNNSKKKKQAPGRPIIAIANEAFTKQLYDLRQVSELVSYPRHSSRLLESLLEELSELENLKLTSSQINDVIAMCHGDLRACLNSLEFGSQSGKRSNACGWAELARRLFSGHPVTDSELYACEQDRLISGLFTQYIHAYFMDDSFEKSCELSEWLGLADLGRRTVASEDLNVTCARAFGWHCRSTTNEFVHLPVPPYLIESAKDIAEKALNRSSSDVKRLGIRRAITELLPYVVKLACPCQPNAILSPENHRRLASCAASLIETGIRFRMEILDTGASVYRMDPPLEETCAFDISTQRLLSTWKFSVRHHLKEALSRINQRTPGGNLSQIEATQTSPPKPPVAPKRAPLTFFGQSKGQVKRQASHIWVSYSEGFSNAVRKNITWDDLFAL